MKKFFLAVAIVLVSSTFVGCENDVNDEIYQIDKDDVVTPGEKG